MSSDVLVVDDDDRDASQVAELIQAHGFGAVRAKSWIEALELLRKNPFHAMILDLNLGTSTNDGFLLMDRMVQEELRVPTQVVSHSADLGRVAASCARYPFARRRPLPKQDFYVYSDYLVSFLRETDAPRAVTRDNRTVFLVHGRDHWQRDRIDSVLKGLGLQTIILERTPSKGQALIELFEQYAARTAYAIVLLTGDDTGRLKTGKGKGKPRARQNVIFELGFFYGQLGRNRVMCLCEPDVERPSDIDGIVYQDLGKSDHEIERNIMKELQATGVEFVIE